MSCIPIRSSIDIMTARTVLRKRISVHMPVPILQAHAAVALTAIAETAIAFEVACAVEIVSLNINNQHGVELRCSMSYSNDLEAAIQEVRLQLAAFITEFQVLHQGNQIYAVARILPHHTTSTIKQNG